VAKISASIQRWGRCQAIGHHELKPHFQPILHSGRR
jgi:hypothetical protein